MKGILKHIVVFILTLEAKVALKRHKPRIIAITGNVGKTSTKDAVYEVVSKGFSARKSLKSQNSEIGLPLTILGLDNAWAHASGWIKNIFKGLKVALFDKSFPEWLVLEVGADHPGDIEKVSKWLRPNIVVLTRMSLTPVHVENFPDAGAVLREKMFLAHALKADGTLVVNRDDLIFGQAVKDLEATKVFYGSSQDAHAKIASCAVAYDSSDTRMPIGMKAEINLGGKAVEIELAGVIGEHLVYPVAAACAVAQVLGIEEDLSRAFESFEPPKGRMRLLKGRLGSVIIDDSYNSSPLACEEAIKSLAGLSVRGRKIAALGDMKELGKDSERAHREIGGIVGENLHMFYGVGEAARFTAEAAHEAGMSQDMIRVFDSSEEAAMALAELVRAGDAVLVKGSQSMRMERVSRALLEDEDAAPELLVRQEKEWLDRQ